MQVQSRPREGAHRIRGKRPADCRGPQTRPVDLDEVQELLRANAVVGVTGTFDQDTKKMTVIGIQCALYDSTVEEDRVARAAGVSAQCSSG